MSQLRNYWPSLEAINHCIRTEAETLDDAVLLAVHESMPLKVREVGTGAEQARSERDLLDAFLAPADDGSAVVVAITGDSGVGKSHMIRWLHAQLQRDPQRERFVIVLIPKTASLRQVVELMLAPLEGQEYKRLHDELARATDTLTPESASRMLAAALTIELKARQVEWVAVLKAGNDDSSLRSRVHHARGLQTVLFQGETFDHWLQPVLLRIVGQALKGGAESSSGDARRFLPSDLDLPEAFDITTASPAAQIYINHLQSNDGAHKFVAARVLQDELDPALRSVFRFSEALGHRTLEEIVNDIRARLLKDGKELLLLIEDFAALAGIQETLLSLMISESDHGGQRVRAPLRTALAVTDGFLPSRQTILTRAKREWVIPSMGTSEEKVIQRFTRMAGRYINAARWGVSALREQFGDSRELDLHAWVKPFDVELDEKEHEQLHAFGLSENNFPLFPLSPLAISTMARREMTVDGRLLFNPRKFINTVLRDILLKRDAHVSRQFPPARFKGASLKTDAELELRAQGHTPTVHDRLVPVLAFWAGDPRNLSDPPQVNEALFTAFGLPWPFQAPGIRVPPTPAPPGSTEGGERSPPADLDSSPTPGSLPTSSANDLGTPGMEQYLEAWATGTLKQNAALRLRTVLAAGLSQRMDWNSLRMAHGQIKKEFFWLPFVTVGNPTSAPKLEVATEERPVPATVRRALAALDRWHANNNSWNYSRAEDDYAYAQALLDHLESQARAFFVQKAEREAALLGLTLHRQALLLRLCKRADPAKAKLADLLEPGEPVQMTDALREMPHIGQLVQLQERAVQSRVELRKLYLATVCCFQGVGSTPYAIDPGRIANAWRFAEEDNSVGQVRFDDNSLTTATAEMSTARLPALVGRHSNAVRSLRLGVVDLAGTAFDAAMLAALKAVIASARRAGVLASQVVNMAEIERSIEWMELTETRDFIRGLRDFTEPASDDSQQAQLATWAKVDLALLGRAHQAMEGIANLLKATQRNATAQLRTEGGADVADKMDRLIASLRSLGDQP